MKKRFLFCLSIAGLMSAGLSVVLINSSIDVKKVEGYSASSLPTTIDLNDTSAANIRSYYSNLNNLSTSERQGSNLLKNLKTILKNGQKYFSYENGENVWKMYEITDRDWVKSPASAISGYNSNTNKITGYSYNTSDPYVRALYINRDVDNQTKAWANHNQDQWGINREHIWPKAEGFDTSGAGGARGDPRHLVAANGYVNNIHSNYYFGYVKTSSSYTDCGSKYSNQSGNLRGTSKTANTGTVFEPQDCDKGDIARAVFYMVARYNYLSGSDTDGIDTNNPNLTLTQNLSDWASSGYTSSTSNPGKLGILTDLLAWHKADPVDEFEIHRNNLLYTNFTKNRNPFVDFPEWVDYIWGTVTYNGSTYVSHSDTPTGYAAPNSDTINGYNGGSTDPVAVTGVTLNVNETSITIGESEVLSASVSPYNATNQTVSWTSSNNSVATVSNAGRVTGVAEGEATITVTTNDGNFTATCAVTVTASGGGGGESGTDDGSVTAASGAFEGWTSDGLGTAYKDGSAKFDSGGDNIYKTDIFSGDVSSGMTSLTVTINGKINGTPTAANSYKVEALDSSGNVLASDVKTGADIVTTSYGDTVFTIDSGLTGCTGIKITYVTKGGGNWGIMSVSWSAEYSSGEEEKTLDSITLDTSDAPTTFNVGDTFSYEGLSVTANYDDGTDDIVVPTSVSTPNMSTAGQKTVTVTYTEGGVSKTATYTITVNAVTLSSIEVSDPKTTYYVGDTFVKPTVTATFSNGSTSDVTNSATFSGYNLSNAGSQTVTVSYTNGTTETTTYSITVTAVTLTSITISGYTTSFKVGDTFSFGGTVTANYNNGSTADVTASASFSGYNMSTSGNQTVTVSYGGKSETYQISVTDDSGATDTTEYTLINSTADLEAGKSYIITNGTSGTVRAAAVTSNTNNRKSVEATISNNKITRGSSILSFTLGGSTGAWTFATENYAGTDGYLASGDASGTSNQLRIINTAGTATIAFSGDAATINIGPHGSRTLICFNTQIDNPNGGFACYGAQGSYGLVYLWKQVTHKVLTSISLDTANVKTTFSVGETFNYTGLVVTANYSNAPSSVVTPTSVSSPNMSTVGQKTVTVSYTEEEVSKSANYTITVNSNPSIDWTAPTINVYTGSVLSGTDVNGWGVTYNDGSGHQTTPTYSQLTVKLGGTTISIPHTWSAEDDGKTLTVTYNSLTTSESSAVQVTQSVNTITQTSEASSETSNLTFTGACGGSGTADDGATWTVTSDAAESTYDSTKGIHYGTGSAAVEYIQLVSDSFTTGTITQVVVNASGASGVTGSVSVTVGGNAFGEVQSFNSTASDKTFTGTASAGQIVVRIYKAAAANKAIYCKSVVVTNNVPGSSTVISNNVNHIAAQRVAVKFANAFNAAMDTTSGCTTNLESAWSTCSSAYDTFLSEAAALGESEEAYAKNLIANATKQYTDDSGEACIERMMKTYQVCVQKHGQTPFMSELVSLSKIAINPLQVSVKNSSTAIIIIVISSISVIAIAGYFYFRRKKN